MQWVFDFVQIRAEGHGNAGFFADFTYRGMTMRFIGVELAFRPTPIVIFRTVHQTDFEFTVASVLTRSSAVYDAACRFNDLFHNHRSRLLTSR